MQDKMTDYPHYPPNAPSVDVFAADELLVLSEWFEVEHPPSERSIEDILDEWDIPQDISEYRRLGAAVAQILLERVQDRLPQWAAVTNDSRQFARPIADWRALRKVEMCLLTINWADSGPGFSWPVAYYATYVPGYNRTVVTASGDCPDALGVCDIALGSFGTGNIPAQSDAIIRGEWANRRREFDQSRWAYILDAGLVGEVDANAWADQVWGDHADDQD
jgi:hypothetical protein